MVNQAVLVTEIVSVVIAKFDSKSKRSKGYSSKKKSTKKFDRKEKSSGGSRPMKGRTFADHQK